MNVNMNELENQYILFFDDYRISITFLVTFNRDFKISASKNLRNFYMLFYFDYRFDRAYNLGVDLRLLLRSNYYLKVNLLASVVIKSISSFYLLLCICLYLSSFFSNRCFFWCLDSLLFSMWDFDYWGLNSIE